MPILLVSPAKIAFLRVYNPEVHRNIKGTAAIKMLSNFNHRNEKDRLN